MLFSVKSTATLLFIMCSMPALAADLSGVVHFHGPAPKLQPIDTKADPYCKTIHGENPLYTDEATIGPNGEFAHIFVWIANPPPGDYPVPAEPVTLDQYGCRYSMPVFGMRVGQTLQFTNSDKTTHNVRGFPRHNRTFNFGQPPGLAPRSRMLDKAEMPLKIKCDVHAWMKSHCFVMEHPFFSATALDGRFTIKDVPPGTYTLKAWHERLGELQQETTVGDGAPAEVKFTYKRLQKPTE